MIRIKVFREKNMSELEKAVDNFIGDLQHNNMTFMDAKYTTLAIPTGYNRNGIVTDYTIFDNVLIVYDDTPWEIR